MKISRDILDSLHTTVTSAAMKRGVDWREAVQIAYDVEERLRAEWGGQRHYVPVPDVLERHRLIMEAFDGTNRDEVCRNFGISRRTLRRIRAQFRES